MGLHEIYDTLTEVFKMPLSYISNSTKRIYFLYLVSSGIIAYYVYYKSKQKGSFIKYLFPLHIWFSKSASVDLLMMYLNSIIKILVIGPYLILGSYIAFFTNDYLLGYFGHASFSLGKVQTLIFYTITLTVLEDFTTYIIHLLMHKVPFLWEFHKVHHSATKLIPLTQYRIHPIELIINNANSILIFGVSMGVFDYLSNHQVSKIMFLGVNVFGFLFMFFGANLRHSSVKLKYPNFLEKLLISPFQHQIHHSNNPSHYSKNLGSKFAVWDRIFGTLILSKSVKNIKFGLGEDDFNYNTFWKNIFNPFGRIFGLVKSYLIK
ncbi:MAG: sterol desaturase family protein [Bacteroidetes bacterium]|nr:sterol desaturase family protein [Bacteroidota bacterium]